MLRTGPYKLSIKKGHLSNSVKSIGSPITKESCFMSQQHVFPWDSEFIHWTHTSFQESKSRECPASRAFFYFLSANDLDGKHLFLLGNLGEIITRIMPATLYGILATARDLHCYCTCRWGLPSHDVQRPSGPQVTARIPTPGVRDPKAGTRSTILSRLIKAHGFVKALQPNISLLACYV